MLQDVIPYLNYLYRKFGKLALIGFCLTLCALILFIVNKSYHQKKLESLQYELAELSSANKLLAQQKMVKQSSGGIDTVFDLRKRSEMLTILERIQITAKNNHIFVDNIEYKFTTLPLMLTDRYEVTFPANGKYLDFRNFLKQLTQDYNGIVVEHIEFSREDNQVSALDGLLKLAVYVESSK